MKCKKCGFEFTEGLFCPECGTKNDFEEEVTDVILENKEDMEDEEKIEDIDKAMDEVIFYYEQSKKKKEAQQNADWLYYDRAQELLMRMINQKIPDYRVWWEACKPIDFWEETFSEQMIEKYKVNDTYFAKALNYADLETKEKIIAERDSYQERKSASADKINKAKAEKAAAKKREEEQKKAEKIQKEKEAREQKEKEEREQKEKKAREQKEWEQRRIEHEGKAMAKASLICGIIALCTLGSFFVPEILGIVFALQGKKQGIMLGQAKTGLICSCVSIFMMVVLFIIGVTVSGGA